jgi:hypothetical protein
MPEPTPDRRKEAFDQPASGDDVLLANAARFLIDGGEEDAASVLLSCRLVLEFLNVYFPIGGEGESTEYAVRLTGPRAAYDILDNADHEVTVQVRRAIEAFLDPTDFVRVFSVHCELTEIDPGWRTEMLEIARGRGVHNQAVQKAHKTWRNLRFRSERGADRPGARPRRGAVLAELHGPSRHRRRA